MLKKTSIPSSETLTQLRANAFTEGVKLLMAVNGGGAIALLAFLQFIWDKNTEMAQVVLIGIGFLLGGLALLLPIQFIRIIHSNRAEKLRKIDADAETRGVLWYLYNSLPYISAIAFIIGIAYLVVSGLIILNTLPT